MFTIYKYKISSVNKKKKFLQLHAKLLDFFCEHPVQRKTNPTTYADRIICHKSVLNDSGIENTFLIGR